jgi:CheY-like chemotaxis protein
VKPILVIDDDDDIREVLAGILKSAGYAVVEANDGKSALDRMFREEAETPCLIVLDLYLPVLSGWDFLAVKERYHRLAAIPVLVITGSRAPLGGLKHQRSVVGYFEKPLDLDSFLQSVDRAAGGHRVR